MTARPGEENSISILKTEVILLDSFCLQLSHNGSWIIKEITKSCFAVKNTSYALKMPYKGDHSTFRSVPPRSLNITTAP